MSRRVGFVGIIIERRDQTAEAVNRILSQHADLILVRTGLPRATGGQTAGSQVAVITLTVQATSDELGALTGRLGALAGVSVKSALAKVGGGDDGKQPGRTDATP